MKFIFFYHSLLSDWNHGNAHFLRGIVTELLLRGHAVEVYEPRDGWSLKHLLEAHGRTAVDAFYAAYPGLRIYLYDQATLDLDAVLDDADVVLVHEWNEPAWIAALGARATAVGAYALFHDTHHRSVTDPESIAKLDLRHYDGVLAFGRTVAECYERAGWAERIWVWHEAADVRRFKPIDFVPRAGDVVWIGNWGDDERTAELHEYLLRPIAALQLRARFHGVRYPPAALAALQAAGIDYGGWIPNFRVPETFAGYGCTVHVPRRAYAQQLRGIPTIRVFEALACGIPLLCAPWNDEEHLFRPGSDYLIAHNGDEMRALLRQVLHEPALAEHLSQHGRERILQQHTCGHRIDQLLQCLDELQPRPPTRTAVNLHQEI